MEIYIYNIYNIQKIWKYINMKVHLGLYYIDFSMIQIHKLFMR